MIALIDNYDSFTYNLYQYILEIRSDVQVFRNDKVSLEDIIELDPSHLVISPGPCTPIEAGISVDVIRELSKTIPRSLQSFFIISNRFKFCEKHFLACD